MSDFETLCPGWYLVKAKVREELRAVDNLENQGFEAYCPQYLEKGRSAVLFPGYLFVRLGSDDLERFHKIRSTRGVTAMVTFNKMAQKCFREGRTHFTSTRKLQEILPQPVPNGEKVIEQIEEIIWTLNGCIEAEKPASIGFKEGQKAVHKNPLFDHLRFVFKHGLKAERGVFLVQYIESLRTDEGVQSNVVSEQTMTIPYRELEKV